MIDYLLAVGAVEEGEGLVLLDFLEQLGEGLHLAVEVD